MSGREQEMAAADSQSRLRRWRILRGLLIGLGLAGLVLILLALVLYNFGGMWLPKHDMRAQYDRLVADGRVRPVDQRFVIPIPGCVCHSDDPYLTMQHAERRISECSECHGGGIGPR